MMRISPRFTGTKQRVQIIDIAIDLLKDKLVDDASSFNQQR